MATDFILRGELQRNTAIDLIRQLDLSKPWSVVVSRYQKKRSSSQNALLHRWFGIIGNEIGDDAESVKHDLKAMFLPKVEKASRITGEVTLTPKGTSDLTTAEMADFMTKVAAFAASQLGIALPHPEDQHAR